MEPEPLTCMFARFNDRTSFLPSYGSSESWHHDFIEAFQRPDGLGETRFLVHDWPTAPVFFSDEAEAGEPRQIDLARFAARHNPKPTV